MSNRGRQKGATERTISNYMLRKTSDTGEQCSSQQAGEIQDGGTESASSMTDMERRLLQAISGVKTEIDDSCERILDHVTQVTTQFNSRFMDIEKSLENAHEKIIEVQQENDKLRSDLQTEVQERVALEKRYKQLSDEVLNLKRYSRQFNVRINGIPEEKKENVKDRLGKFIQENHILGDLQKEEIVNRIEYCHRTGKKEDGKHRQIIARLYSREVKNSLVFGGKRKGENGRNLIQEDFIKEDYENRKKALPLMRAAFSEGKKCKFVNGQLIIGGQRITVH